MTKTLKCLLFAVIASSTLFLPSVALAVDEATSTNSSSTTNSGLRQRIEQRKNELKEAVSAAEQERLKLRCKAAQAIVGKAADNVNQLAPERLKNYQALQDSLNGLIAKIKAAGIDTTTLEQETATLSNKAAQIKNDFDSYKQQLADLKDMDCASDPAGFKASLEAARATHAVLVREINDIKSYVVDTIKPTLEAIRKQLAEEKTESTEGTQ